MSILPQKPLIGEHPDWLAEYKRTGKPIPYDPVWWQELRDRKDPPAHTATVSLFDGHCHTEYLPPYRRRWAQLLTDFPVLAKGINDRHLLMEPSGTLPDPMPLAELARFVGSICRPEIAEPIIAAFGPYIARIVRAVVRDELRRAS